MEDIENKRMERLEKALEVKKKGNELYMSGEFQQAIEVYTEAIDMCPPSKFTDLSVMYQNRAVSKDRLDRVEEALDDCEKSLELNNRYVKALDRRARVLRKVAEKLTKETPNFLEVKIEKLKQALEDISMFALLKGYSNEHLMFVDGLLKELGSAEAIVASRNRKAVKPSVRQVGQYFESFCEDPLQEPLEGEGGFKEAKECLDGGKFEEIAALCDKEIAAGGTNLLKAKLLKATFHILNRQQSAAMEELNQLIDSIQDGNVKIKANALIKRATLYIQQCNDPNEDPKKSLEDLNKALEIDPDNADIHHHRGQVNLLLEKTADAIKDLEKALELKPNFAMVSVEKIYTECLLAQAEQNDEKVTELIEEFKAVINKFPKYIDAYAVCAKILFERQEIDAADAMYVKGLEVDPTNATLTVHRALLELQKSGDAAKAVEEMERALKMDPDSEFALQTLGTLEMQRENLSRAVELFDLALPLINTELEMAHLFGLRDSALAKISAKNKLSVVPTGMQDITLD